MQRNPLLSLALLSPVAASTAAVADPLSLNPCSPRQAPPSAYYDGQGNGPAPGQVAQNQYGGGFFELLFRGPGGGSREASPTYRQYPAGDMGPGMVESPNGQPVM